MKTLLIMRHGKAERTPGKRDFDRDLEPRGRTQAVDGAMALKITENIPDRIISSPAARAYHTADILRRECALPEEVLQAIPSLYLCSLEEMVFQIRCCPDYVSTLLVVGHNPAMEYFSDQATGNDSRIKTSEIRGFSLGETQWSRLDPGQLEYLGIIYSH